MPKIAVNQTNFTAGELSPRLRGRTDIARYQNGAETVENAWVDVHGGLDRRDGTRYCAVAKFAGARKARLVKYVFSQSQAYMLEFGHLYVRFFNVDGSVLLNAAGNAPLEVVSPFIESQLFEFTFRQGADTMFLFHKDVPTQRMRRISAGAFTLQPVPWVVQPFAELGHAVAAQLSLSASTIGAGRTFTTSAVTVPGAPTIGAASALNAAANVAFTAPVSNGGLLITGYTATSSPGGFTGTDTGSPVRVGGLTNGVAYTFTVVANNGIGNSVASAASNSVTPSGSLPSTAVSVALTSYDFSDSANNGTYVNQTGPTASVSGSVAPFNFLWTKVSGDAGLTVNAGNAALPQLNFNATGARTILYAIFRCTASDIYGGSGFKDVNLSFEFLSVEKTPTGGIVP
jgi:hypothetical protein